MTSRAVSWVLVLALGAVAPLCRADIYAYTDSSGTTHFSNVPDDARYKLIVRAPVETPAGVPADARRAAAWLARSSDYDAAITRAAGAAKVQEELVRAVIVVESGFNPRAISRRGAIGLMQLLPSTARRYGAFNAFDPEENIRAGARYLADLIARYGKGKLELVLAAYNAGENAVERYGGRVPPYKETRAYVPNVLRMYRALLVQSAGSAAGTDS
jgi:soluble lytic murein transglycosylase-like protein